MVPVITLTNGLRIANFSSPHPFTFVSGEVLPACSPERAKRLLLEAKEVARPSPCGRWTDIDLSFRLSPEVEEELQRLELRQDIDIVLVPLPVLQASRALAWATKVRGLRAADRVTKEIHSDRFCT